MGVTGRECVHGEGAETGYSSGIKLVIIRCQTADLESEALSQDQMMSKMHMMDKVRLTSTICTSPQ